MSLINPRNVVELLLEEYKHQNLTEVNGQEIVLKNHIKEIIETSKNSEDIDVMSYLELTIDIDNTDVEEIHEQLQPVPKPNDKTESSNSDFSPDDPSPSQSRTLDDTPLDYKKKAIKFWRNLQKNGKKQSFLKVQKMFRKIKDKRTLYRWASQVDNHSSYRDKMDLIAEATFQEFSAARGRGFPMHDMDLKRWARNAAVENGVPQFKASNCWLESFKLKNRIVSRKITKVVSRLNFANLDKLREKATAFVESIKPHIEEVGPSNMYNTDQSGFYLETHSGRTLHFKETKKIETVVQSVNSTIHSYTIQPTISCDGRLVGPLLIVLPEKDGKFGPLVQESIFRPDNVRVVASKSGKCTTEIMKYWYTNIFLPNVGEESVLLVDSWGGSKKMVEDSDRTKTVRIKTIPEGTTGMSQPWDCFGARPWKNYLRRLSGILLVTDPSIVLHQRNNIIKMQSLVYNQMSSPRYCNLFKYSWVASGYVQEKGETFPNPAHFAFDSLGDDGCIACEDDPVVRCSWCKDALCTLHFFVAFYNCTNYNQ